MLFIPPAIAFVVFLTLGYVAWSYRDVSNRHSDRVQSNTGSDAHGAGH